MAKYEYKDQCGSCEEFFQCRGNWDIPYDKNDTEKGYCRVYKTTYWPDDSCGNHKERYEAYSGCYITTIVCDILGFEDNCEVLTNLRKVRDKFMQKNDQYKKDLFDYDTIGPQIAKILNDDYQETKDKTVATALYTNYLVPAANEAKENNYTGAITIYKKMTNLLKNTFKVKTNDELLREYDQTKGGHGYIKTREA